MRLIALKPLPRAFKNLRGGRVLPGDEFDAKDGIGRALIGVKRARDPADRRPGKLPPPPPEVVAAVPEVAAEPPEAAPADQAEPAVMEAASVAEHPESLDPDAEKERLRADAEALGIDVDGRWGVARLHEEIAKAEGEES